MKELWIVFVKNNELYSMWCDRIPEEIRDSIYYIGEPNEDLWKLVKASRRGEYAPR